MSDLYDRDFYAWANQQATLLKRRAAGELTDDTTPDWLNLATEIESMGRSEKRELVSRLAVLLLHLLKWQYQPTRRGKTSRVSIENTRDDLQRHLADNPSLKAKLPEAIADAYRRSRRDAYAETDLPEQIFPPECPWSYDQIIDPVFWPDGNQPPERI